MPGNDNAPLGTGGVNPKLAGSGTLAPPSLPSPAVTPTGRAKPCGICGQMYEVADLVMLGNHCRPCWDAHCRRSGYFGPPPRVGWWQLCERCGIRNWVITDRPLCPVCVRLPRRWKQTSIKLCRGCRLPFRPDRRNRIHCGLCNPRTDRMMRARTQGTHTAAEWAALLFEYAYSCAYCGVVSASLTKDHVIPVSRGGSDSIDNILPACRSCNSSKQAADVAAWKARRLEQVGS